MNFAQKNKVRLALIAVLLVGAALRGYHLDHGLPELYEEATPMHQAWEMWAVGGVDLNPHFFNYPSLTFYTHLVGQLLYYATLRVTGGVQSVEELRTFYQQDPSSIVMVARWITVLFCLGAVWGTYRLGRRLSGPEAGIAAAGCIAVLPDSVLGSRVIQVDLALMLFSALALEAAVRYARDATCRLAATVGLWTGLAASSKYTGAMLFVAFLAGLVLQACRQKGRDAVRSLTAQAGLCLVGAAVAFAATSPYCLLDLESFFSDLSYERVHMAAGHFGLAADGAPAFYPTVLWENLGVWLLPLLLLGLFAILRDPSLRSPWIAPGAFLGMYLVVVATWSMYAGRYLLPVWPVLAVLVACGWKWAADRFRESRPVRFRFLPELTMVILLIPAGLHSLAAVTQSATPDPRSACKEWILANVKPGAVLAMERYTPDLPDTYPVIRIPMVAVAPEIVVPFYDLRWYADCEYLVTSSAIQLRYQAEPDRFDLPNNFYTEISGRWPLAVEFGGVGSSGPGLRVYRNPAPAQPGQPFDTSLAGLLDRTTTDVGWKFVGGIAMALSQSGRISRASDVTRIMAAVNPDEILTYRLAADLLAVGGRTKEALEVCLRGVRICAAGPVRDALEARAEALWPKVRAELDRERRALDRQAGDTQRWLGLVESYERLGLVKEALATAIQGLQDGGGDRLSRKAIGLLTAGGDLVRAASLVEEGLRHSPGRGLFHALRGALLEQEGDLEGAASAYMTASDLPGTAVVAELGLGNLAYRRGDRDSALTWWRRATERDSTAVLPHLNRGFVLLEKGDTEEALEVWQRGSRACGGDPSLAYNLSQLYRSRGETTKAFEVMIASLCMFPDDVDLMAGLGELWEALGNTAKARRYYRSAGRLAPGRTDIQQMRVRVGG